MTTTNMHNIVTMNSKESGVSSWLEIVKSNGNILTVFMPTHESDAIAASWNAAHISPPEKAMMDAMFDKLDLVPS